MIQLLRQKQPSYKIIFSPNKSSNRYGWLSPSRGFYLASNIKHYSLRHFDLSKVENIPPFQQKNVSPIQPSWDRYVWFCSVDVADEAPCHGKINRTDDSFNNSQGSHVPRDFLRYPLNYSLHWCKVYPPGDWGRCFESVIWWRNPDERSWDWGCLYRSTRTIPALQCTKGKAVHQHQISIWASMCDNSAFYNVEWRRRHPTSSAQSPGQLALRAREDQFPGDLASTGSLFVCGPTFHDCSFFIYSGFYFVLIFDIFCDLISFLIRTATLAMLMNFLNWCYVDEAHQHDTR